MLALHDIDKRFGATHAVRSVTLEAPPGTVLGLVGENGAGKSTVLKILSGVVQPDAGRMWLGGREIAPRSAADALACGIASVFQELTLVPTLSVEQNLLLTRAPRTPWLTIDRRACRRIAQEMLGRYRLDADVRARTGSLPLGRQQMLEIVRAVERRPKLLLLDEATASLGAAEVQWLRALVERLKREGTTILFISHRWGEIADFCNRVAVMRNGALVAEADVAAISEGEAVRLMTGESIQTFFPAKPAPGRDVVLRASALRSPALDGVTFDLRAGEILGLGGLVGQGQGPLLEALFGAHPLQSGTIEIGGRALAHPAPRAAIRQGIAYIPQERKSDGLLLSKSVAFNMTLAILKALASLLGLVIAAREDAVVRSGIRKLQIKVKSPAEPVRNLSGGNQQKVLLEKWLLTNPKVLLLNDVTRGVDVGTKHQLYELVARIASEGVGVIWYSTDTLELSGVSHRVLVMAEGTVNAALAGDRVNSEEIVRASFVGGANVPAAS